MGRKTKLSVEQKVNICEQYLDGKKSVKELSQEFDVGVSIIRLWSKMYQANGANGFQPSLHNATYTKEFKQQVVEAYFNKEGTIDDLIIKYEIPSSTTLRKWIEKYNNLEELKDYDPKPEVYMKNRSRKITLEERVQIVTYCLEHKKNYKEAAELFDVSYTQIYQWVKKYLGAGEEGLVDRRGQHKAEEQLSDNEILKRKVKILERQIREKEMEIDLLKKVQEIERRRSSPRRKTNQNT